VQTRTPKNGNENTADCDGLAFPCILPERECLKGFHESLTFARRRGVGWDAVCRSVEYRAPLAIVIDTRLSHRYFGQAAGEESIRMGTVAGPRIGRLNVRPSPRFFGRRHEMASNSTAIRPPRRAQWTSFLVFLFVWIQ